MSILQKRDVIIVGGGPAGSTAAYLLKKKYNIEVLLIDKHHFPREKLCGGLITYKTVRLLEELFDEHVSDLVKNGVINYQTNIYKLFYRTHLLHDGMSKWPFYFVKRSVYDLFLLDKAKHAGVEVIEGKSVKKYDSMNNQVFLEGDRSFTAKYLIGADGAHSIIRKQLLKNNPDKNRWMKNLATAFEFSIDRTAELKGYNYPAIYFGYLRYGYCWIFPNAERILYGIGGFNTGSYEIRTSFQLFLTDSHFPQINVSRVKSSFIPLGYFHQIPAASDTALIGDAGGFVNPFTGEGIYYAQRSGAIAAEAINQALHHAKSFRNTYVQLLNSRIFPDFMKAKRVRNIYYRLTNRVFYVPLKMFLRGFDRRIDQFLHGV